MAVWRNGSALLSGGKGSGFESQDGRLHFFGFFLLHCSSYHYISLSVTQLFFSLNMSQICPPFFHVLHVFCLRNLCVGHGLTNVYISTIFNLVFLSFPILNHGNFFTRYYSFDRQRDNSPIFNFVQLSTSSLRAHEKTIHRQMLSNLTCSLHVEWHRQQFRSIFYHLTMCVPLFGTHNRL